MGHGFEGKCAACGHKTQFRVGGGFFFHLLHCDRCGKERSIAFDKLRDVHERYVKGLRGPWTVVTMDRDQEIQENAPIQPLSHDEYHHAIEELVGKCPCGGQFSMTAPPRCPRCQSAEITQVPGLEMFYD